MRNIRCLYVLTALLISVFAKAADSNDDYGNVGGSVEVDITKRIIKGLELSVEEEIRFRDNFTDVERFSTSADLSYKPCKYLKAGAAYNLINLNHIKKGWEIRHRYYFYATGSYKLGRSKLSQRERVQSTYRVGVKETAKRANPKWYLRSRFGIDYNIRKSPFEPFVAVEFFNSLNNPLGDSMDRYRLTGGCAYKLSKQSAFQVYYRYTKDQNPGDDDILHMICVGYSFKF